MKEKIKKEMLDTFEEDKEKGLENIKKENKVVRKHAERRVKFTDTFLKKLRSKDKPYSIGDSEVPG